MTLFDLGASSYAHIHAFRNKKSIFVVTLDPNTDGKIIQIPVRYFFDRQKLLQTQHHAL